METFLEEQAKDNYFVPSSAWTRFQDLGGLPSDRTENYKYFSVQNLRKASFQYSAPVDLDTKAIQKSIYPECQESVLVFINGYYQAKLSNTSALPKNVLISFLRQAFKDYSVLAQNLWFKSINEETDPFALLNAHFETGIFLYIPPKIQLEKPIQFLNIIHNQDKAQFMNPRLQIYVGSHSSCTFVTNSAYISGEKYCYNIVTDLTLDLNSQVTYVQDHLNIPQNSWHFDALRANLKSNSSLKSLNLTTGSTSIRNDYKIALNGANAEASLNGLSLLSEKNEAHTHILMDHQAPHCRSMQLFKNVLDGFSRSSFEGKILVRQQAQKTDAFQLNNNLLISERAQANSKPNLEIFADDVKASHGATVGSIDPDQKHYLETRGIDSKTAQKMLLKSFCQEITEMIPFQSISNKIALLA